MSLAEQMRADLGIDRVEAKLDDVLQRLDQMEQRQDWYSIEEVAKRLTIRPAEVKAMLEDGRLWKLEGTQSSIVRIPHAAYASLQDRPTSLRAVS